MKKKATINCRVQEVTKEKLLKIQKELKFSSATSALEYVINSYELKKKVDE